MPVQIFEEVDGPLLTSRPLYHETTNYKGTYQQLTQCRDLAFDKIIHVLGEDKAAGILSIRVSTVCDFSALYEINPQSDIASRDKFHSLECIEAAEEAGSNSGVAIFLARAKLQRCG
jgi:hypothetical protein